MPQNVANTANVQCGAMRGSTEMSNDAQAALVRDIPARRPVLIAGPTASGKSALALEIATQSGGVVVNADASQVYDCWRVISARPSPDEESRAPHRLYGHLSQNDPYSTGHWLREVAEIVAQDQRPIIVGGTGLYFKALIHGLADIPATPPQLRKIADDMPHEQLIAELDPQTAQAIDLNNRARVQRAWEVLTATGRGLTVWQAQTPPPLLPLSDCSAIAINVDRDWLASRIEQRFDLMLEGGALEEVRAIEPYYDPSLPAHKAIGVPELIAHLSGELTLDQAREAAIIATRQYAKRQRTWIRSNMADWAQLYLPE